MASVYQTLGPLSPWKLNMSELNLDRSLPYFILPIGGFTIYQWSRSTKGYPGHLWFTSSVILSFSLSPLCVSVLAIQSRLLLFKVHMAAQIYGHGLQASVLIMLGYITLLGVNSNYISLGIIPIIMLAFIGALCRQVALSLKCEDDNNSTVEANKMRADDDGGANKGDHYSNNGSAGNKDEILVGIAVVPYWVLVLCSMRQEQFLAASANMVVSQFLLFLTFSLGRLTLMLARLPSSSEVAPAMEVLRRASLAVMVLTAHTMAVELLGEHAVLVCTPELVAALLWFITLLRHGNKSTTLITVDKATSWGAGVVSLSVVMAVLANLNNSMSMDCEFITEGENQIARYTMVFSACAASAVLPSLCVFALQQWSGETKAVSSSSELAGAIRLFSFCRNVMFIAAAMFLVFICAAWLIHARLWRAR